MLILCDLQVADCLTGGPIESSLSYVAFLRHLRLTAPPSCTASDQRPRCRARTLLISASPPIPSADAHAPVVRCVGCCRRAHCESGPLRANVAVRRERCDLARADVVGQGTSSGTRKPTMH